MDGMKEHPILFSAPMVRAILAGQKTQTRRAVKPEGAHHLFPFIDLPGNPTGEWAWCSSSHVVSKHIRCLYGQPGDRLWVKETFYAWGRWVTRFSTKKGRDEWHFIDMTTESGKQYRYQASMAGDTGPRERGSVTPQWWKRPAIFMPRLASRITLEVTGVRVERLHDISEEDAEAEGCTSDPMDGPTFYDDYRRLWESINGAGSWAANPYAWVIEFRRIEQ